MLKRGIVEAVLGTAVDPEGFASSCSNSHHPLKTDRPGADADRLTNKWISSSPFTKSAPESLDSPIRSVLEASNQERSARCGGFLAGWDELHDGCSGSTSRPGLVKPQESTDAVCWEALPPRE